MTCVALSLRRSQVRSEKRLICVHYGIARRGANNEWHTKCPPFGFKWARRRGTLARVINRDEQAIAERIVQMRDDGHSWHQMVWGLLDARVKTSAGKDWSVPRVRKVFVSANRARTPSI